MRIFSSGGGVQSTAALVLSARGEIDFPIHVFSNVGDDSEHPETLAYVREIAEPYAAENGIEFHEIRWLRRDGTRRSLREHIFLTEHSIPIPARMGNSGAPGNRTWTADFKIKVVDRWIAEHGGKGKAVTVGLGISTDEIHRARIRSVEIVRGFEKTITYPLIDLMFSRSSCVALIADAGLPIPPRSSCYFCPFRSNAYWINLRRESPDLFDDAVAIEDRIRYKRQVSLGKNDVFLHRSRRPLRDAVGLQMAFDDLDNCESGYCMT